MDPTREDGGINLYGFVANNATRFADAFGLGWWADFKCRFWPLFFRPPGGSGSPKPSGPNPSGGGTVVDVSGGGFYGVGGTAGSQVLRLDDGTVSSYLYGGFGIGTPGWSGSVQGGRVFDVHVPSDYAGPFINVSGGAFGGGGSYSFWPGGSSSVTGGFATPGISVSFQYYVQPPSVESLFWWPPYSPRPVLRISLPQ